MIEIIPNWHPIFVHFTVALLSLAVVFWLVGGLLREGALKQQLLVFARWNLWLGTAFGLVTGLAGWDAYNTVAHDTPSHVAMTEHRNWALAALSVFAVLSAWSFLNLRKQREAGVLFVVVLLAGGALLGSTAWHGGELVYRYGLGVMSLPEGVGPASAASAVAPVVPVGADGHAHATDVAPGTMPTPPDAAVPATPPGAVAPDIAPAGPVTPVKPAKPRGHDGHAHQH